MADEEEWMERYRDMEGDWKGEGHQHGRTPRIISEPVLIAWKLT